MRNTAPGTRRHSDAIGSRPPLLVVHGAGGNGSDFLNYWKAYAESHGIVLVAPTLSLTAEMETRVPELFPLMMNTVKHEWNLDPARCYLFGYSAGGYSVFDAALLNADYFAGAAVFASIIAPAYDSIARQAPRRTAIAIYIGDRDQFFSLQQTRRTRDPLQANGDHQYAAVSDWVDDDAWQFLSRHQLAQRSGP